MTIELYRVFHVVGLVLTALGLGAILGAGDGGGGRRSGLVLHGLGILVLAVAGFGMMARLGLSEPGNWPVWLIAKMVVWLVVGLFPVLLRLGVPRTLGWVLAAVLAGLAAWLGIFKPM